MNMFKKVLNFKIFLIIISEVFLFTSSLYSYGISNNSLRVPIQDKSYIRYIRMLRKMRERDNIIDLRHMPDDFKETGNVNGIRYAINWKNWKQSRQTKPFNGNREPIREDLKSFLGNKEKVKQILGRIGIDISYEDIVYVNIQYLYSSERVVFRITFFSNNDKPLATIVAKYVDSIDKRKRASIFGMLKDTSFVPKFGGWYRKIYYEEWIKGLTVHQLSGRRALNSVEIQNITAIWVKIREKAYAKKIYRQYRLDMNSANILYRERKAILPDFAVVDIFAKEGISQTTPAYFMRDIMKIYILGSYTRVKSKIPNDVEAVLRGIYKGFDYDKVDTRKFLEEALGENMDELRDFGIEKIAREFIVNELGNSNPAVLLSEKLTSVTSNTDL